MTILHDCVDESTPATQGPSLDDMFLLGGLQPVATLGW
jgi:hypothetical protein